jgi:hypothetical protein
MMIFRSVQGVVCLHDAEELSSSQHLTLPLGVRRKHGAWMREHSTLRPAPAVPAQQPAGRVLQGPQLSQTVRLLCAFHS